MTTDQSPTPDDTEPLPLQELYCPQCEKSFPGGEYCPEDGTKLIFFELTSENLTGAIIDKRFQIGERIGIGGMGAVYQAKQLSVGRDVAIKVIDKQLSKDPTAAKRFLREAKLASRLTHPNTAVVFDFGQTDDGLLYLAMELLDGEDLSDRLKRVGKLPIDQAVDITKQLCEALDAAHKGGIVHRDLKPSNVMLQPRPGDPDRVKVLDFGIARPMTTAHDTETVANITRSNVVIGTPAYISPEGALARDVDGRSDLYSVGVILYHMVSGHLPFRVANTNEYLLAHASETPRALGAEVPVHLQQIIGKLLAKKPDQRYQTAAELKQALVMFAEGPPQAAPPSLIRTLETVRAPADTVSALPAVARRRRVPPSLIVGAVAALGALIALVVFTGKDDATPATSPNTGAGAEAKTPEAVPTTEPTPPPAPGAKSDDVAPPPTERTTVSLRANHPADATVQKDGKRFSCKTPCELDLPRGGEAQVEFTRRGYVPVRETVQLDGPQAELEAKLRKKPRRRPSRSDDRPF